MKLKSLFLFIIAFILFYAFNPYPSSEISGIPVMAADTGIFNPFDKQDDKEVPYDRSYWIQPGEWNIKTVDPRDYEGGIMLFFDKIGLEREYARGKVQRVYFSLVGATENVGIMKFHVFYDTRLRIRENSKGEVVTTGKMLENFTTGSKMIENGQFAFYAYSSEDQELNRGCIFTIDFIVPENAEMGDVYPIGIVYQDDGIVADTFIKGKQDMAGRLQMTYVFTKGIYNGYIKILGEKPYLPGDVNKDRQVNAVDASLILEYYALMSTNMESDLTDDQKKLADINNDGQIDTIDASAILSYYAETSTNKEQ